MISGTRRPRRGTMTDDLSRLDATAQAELVRSGAGQPAELVDAAIERIEQVNPELNAVITPLLRAGPRRRPRRRPARRAASAACPSC